MIKKKKQLNYCGFGVRTRFVWKNSYAVEMRNRFKTDAKFKFIAREKRPDFDLSQDYNPKFGRGIVRRRLVVAIRGRKSLAAG